MKERERYYINRVVCRVYNMFTEPPPLRESVVTRLWCCYDESGNVDNYRERERCMCTKSGNYCLSSSHYNRYSDDTEQAITQQHRKDVVITSPAEPLAYFLSLIALFCEFFLFLLLVFPLKTVFFFSHVFFKCVCFFSRGTALMVF